jgi:hypothetical protein
MTTQIKINYKEYPEFMFAMIVSYLPSDEGNELRKLAGRVVFRHDDKYHNTYKNGLLHSYDDKPARIIGERKEWYVDGKLHRDNDQPAVVKIGFVREWYRHGLLHREYDKPAIINDSRLFNAWYVNGLLHRYSGPAIIDDHGKMWYIKGIYKKHQSN